VHLVGTLMRGIAHTIHGVPPDPPVTKNISQYDCPCKGRCDYHEDEEIEY
jgi:hypothetical protein